MHENGTEVVIEATPEADDRVLLTVIGDLDCGTAPMLEQAVAEQRDAGHSIVLDLRWVTFMDSTALVMLLRLAAQARLNGWTFEISSALSDRLARLVSVTGTRRILPFVD